MSCLPIWSADRTWCGKDGGSWSVAENWEPAGVPGTEETAKFYDAVTVVVSETVTPGGIYVNQGGTLTFSEAGCLVKEGDFEVDGLAVGFDGAGVSASWRSVLVAKEGRVIGTPAYDGGKLRTRIVRTARGDELQYKLRQGLSVILR